MNYKLLSFFTMTLVLFGTLSCQDAIEHNGESDPKFIISSGSSLAQLISYSALKDGSYDNILDNSSAISIQLPVKVLANNQELLIENEDDFENIRAIFAQEPFVRDSLKIDFPATAIYADYSEIVLENQDQLDQIIESTVVDGTDEDIECYSLHHPLRISLYDQLNQRASSREISNDKEAYLLFSELNENQLAAFNFPITLTDNEDNQLTVSDNNSLASLLEDAQLGCKENDEKFYDDEVIIVPTSRLKILLTDAPFPIDLVKEANITIQELILKNSEGVDEENLLVLSTETSTINLLELTNGLTNSLVDIQVPAGNYDQIRMVVDEASVLLENGDLYDLKVPSGATSGIKINLNPTLEVTAGDEYEILLDFDVSRSFIVKGNPDTPAGIKGFNFKPVIKAANLANTGSIAGTVMDVDDMKELEDVQLTIYAADTVNTTAYTNGKGQYKILGLTAGTYDISTEYAGYVMESIVDIEVTPVNESTIDIELTKE